MNNKLKTSPQNPLAYWWNEFLFARPFAIRSPLSPGTCEHALYSIAHPVEGGWFSFNPVSKTVDIVPEGDHARFDIRLKRRNRRMDYTMAKAEGTIAYDEASGETIIQGRTKFGAFQYLLIVVYLLILSVVFVNVANYLGAFSYGWMIFAFVFGVGFAWWRMYSDRTQLTSLIEGTLRQAEYAASDSAKFKRGDTGLMEEDAPLEYDDADAQYRKRR